LRASGSLHLRSKDSEKEKRKRLRSLIKNVLPGAERERAKLVVVQAFLAR
jgi:hypothetical protein